MKKILVMLLVLLGLGMAACSLEGFGGGNNNNKPEHKHSIVEGWKNDSANHWQLCDSCDEKLNLAAHEFSEWEKVEGLDLEIRSCLCGWEEQRNTEPETKDFTVYYYNSLNWETVNAYAWNESGALNGEWPGSVMAAEAEGWYTVTLSVTSLDGVGIIFNNGATQTDDITLASGKVYYYGLNVEGFASKEEALAAYDAEQEVPVVPNTYYLRGSMNGWGTSAPLTVNGDVASIEIEILRTDEFKVACAEWSDKNFGITNGEVAINGGNFKVEKSGLYRVSVINYGTEQETVTIELLKEYQDQVVKNDFYFRGTINSVNHWNTCNETVKFVAGETSATFEVTLAVGDEFKVAVAGDGWTPQYNANNATYEADHIGGTDNFVVKTAGKYKLEITGWGTAEEKLVITLVEASDTPIVPVEKVYTIEINGVSYTLTLDEDATLDTNQTAEYTVTVDSVLKGQTVVVKSNGEAIINIGAHGTGQNVVGNGGEGMSIVNDATNVTVAFKLWQDGGHSLAVSGYEVPVVPEEKVYTVEINGTSHTLALNTDKQDAVEYFVKGVALAEGDTLVVKLNGEDVEATADPYETNNLTSDMKVRTATANAEHGIYVKVSTDSYVVWVDGYTAPVDEDVETVYYLVGDFNEWTASDEYKLALDENDEAQQVLLNVVINANEKFKLIAVQGEKITWLGYSIFEGDTELSISGEGDSNITIGEAGTYNFYYKFADNKLWVSKVDNSGEEGGETPVEPTASKYYVRGSLNSWGTPTEAHNLLLTGTTASITLVLFEGEELKVAEATWNDSTTKAYHSGLSSEYFANNGGNIKVLKSGTYTISVVNYGAQEKLTIEYVSDEAIRAYDYYLRGSFAEEDHWNTLTDDYKLVVEDGVASITKKLEVNDEFKVATKDWNLSQFKYSSSLIANFGANGENIVVKVAGTYKISILNYGTTNQQLAIEGVDVDVVEPETPEEKEKVTVYYNNSENFAKVYAYSWNTNGDLLGVWPGREMTAETDEWYKIEIEAESLAGINIIFNNGSDSQTPDIVLDSVNPYYYGMNTKGYSSFEAVEEKLIEPAPELSTKLFLKPNSNWTQSGARFAAYFFGNGEKWVSMTDSDGDGIYEVEVPSGFSKVIFCRMNPGTTANNWNNKWNQTGDLTVPTDDKNLFTIPSGAWDGSTTEWSTK